MPGENINNRIPIKIVEKQKATHVIPINIPPTIKLTPAIILRKHFI